MRRFQGYEDEVSSTLSWLLERLTDAERDRLLAALELDETWLEVERSGWVVAYRLVARGRAVELAELRVFPAESKRNAGRWSGSVESVPAGGIGTDALRLVKPGEDKRAMLERLDGLRRSDPVVARALDPRVWGVDDLAEEMGKMRHRDDLFYARVAQLYADEVKAGNSRPVAAVARLLGRPQTHVRDVVKTARDRGLLSKTREGKAGGRLTAKARRLLAEPGEKDNEKEGADGT